MKESSEAARLDTGEAIRLSTRSDLKKDAYSCTQWRSVYLAGLNSYHRHATQ